jgi:hypothetical protein
MGNLTTDPGIPIPDAGCQIRELKSSIREESIIWNLESPFLEGS